MECADKTKDAGTGPNVITLDEALETFLLDAGSVKMDTFILFYPIPNWTGRKQA
jgi:hypothetical protein